MGLPINGNEKNCNPISSNCVVWQGPDIPCLNLCTGATVTDVVADLGTQFCELLDMFNIKNYDLTCLSNCPKVENIQELIQLIITNLCDLQACCTQTTPGTSADVNPNLAIAPCFYYVNGQGDTVTFMPLQSYAVAIGNRLCTIVGQITTLQGVAVNHAQRITALEEKPEPTFTLPEIVPTCVLPAVLTPIDEVLAATEEQFCQLKAATGSPNRLFQAIGKECPGLNADKRLGPGGGLMSSITGWQPTVQNLADSLNNMWLTICDLRSAVKTIQLNCCPTGCSDVALSVAGVVTGGTTLKLYFTGTIPTGFTQCSGSTLVKVQDTDGASITFSLNLGVALNDPAGYSVDISSTPLNASLDFTVTSNVCLENGDVPAHCETLLECVVANTIPCPSPITLTPGSNSVTFAFPSIVAGLTYMVDLYDALGTTLIASQTIPAPTPTTVTGTFLTLTGSTIYKFRVRVGSGGSISTCPFSTVTTQPDNCLPPEGVTATITIP